MRKKTYRQHKTSICRPIIYCLFSFTLFFITVPLIGQDPCGFKDVMESYTSFHLNSSHQRSSSSSGTCAGTYQIPIVFHVLHNNGPENISNEQIIGAVDQLNNQFAGGEGGYNTQISFYIANVDPQGNCTSGINRIQTNDPGILNYGNNTTDANMKNLSRWPVAEYLNVWIVGYIGSGSVNGYSYLPPVSANLDGVVIAHDHLGISGTASGNNANTLAHEIGHYLNLYHLWGQEWFGPNQDKCEINCDHVDCENSGDMVCDTDPMRQPLIIIGGNCNDVDFSNCAQCPNFPQNTFVYEKDNYMSYQHSCQNKFTEGQAHRMCHAINDYRSTLPKQKKEGCNNDCITSIKSNTLINNPQVFGGNIVVENGATLHIHLTNIKFGVGKGIIVKNGGRLILQGSTIDACNPSQSWAGIKIESGGFFETDETFLKNVANGVEAYANSTLQIYKLNIDGKGNTSGIGLKLDGNVNTDFIYNLDVKDFNVGIQSYSSTKVHEFNHGSIFNTTYGISSIGSPLIVNDYGIYFSNDAISLMSSAGSSIFDCNIIYKQQGISITVSPSTTVENCSITNNDWFNGIENLNERPAIGMVLSDNCNISNNYPISSAANAVSAWGSNGAIIENNSISTNFSLNGQLTGGPVNLQFGNGHSVTNNNITADQSEFGINSSWAGNTTIMNNTVYNSGFQKNFRTAAIKATGNLGEIIHQNIVTGDRRTGVLVQNTTGNDFFCNEINSTYDEAQDILYNSEQQIIKANTFDGGGYDLKIKSEIGFQGSKDAGGFVIENWGNLFFGGNAEADQAVVIGSQFPYNPVNANHKPANPNPSSGWFAQNTVVPYANCDGLIIGDNFIFGNDPTKICAYWNYLKSIRNTKPELFFVKLVHLLKYAKTKSGFVLPNCIKFDPVFQTLCGITKIVDVSVALAKVSMSSINTTNFQSLQDQYKSESSDAGKAAIKDQMSQEMTLIKPQFDNERNADSLRLDSLKNELNTINCTSIIVNKWKEILKIYINFIKQGQVQSSDRSALESYSSDCSDLYGEAIHLARAMANTYNRTYYDVNDGCLDVSTPRYTISNEDVHASISPNPTTGLINIDFSGEYSGIVNVIDLSGRIVHRLNLDRAYSSNIDLSQSQAGIYFVKLTSEAGKTEEFKIILIK